MSATPFRILAAAASAAGVVAYARYRRELRDLCQRVDSGSTIAETPSGEIEYAETGEGEAMLVVHGAGGGYDQGLLIASELGKGHRVIAPSRFGYLKTPVPQDYSPAAQADAHAALLDFLDVPRAIVVAASAGAPSAIELALRHPARVSRLILLVPRTYHPSQSIGSDESVPSRAVLRLIESSADFLFWLAMRVSRASVVRFFGVPPDIEAKASRQERERASELMRSVLPLSARVAGIELDGLTTMKPWPLERIGAPTLIISAEDDLYNTLPGARFTADHIPSAELHVLRHGGHLMIGQTARVARIIEKFLKQRKSRAAVRQVQPHAQLELVDA